MSSLNQTIEDRVLISLKDAARMLSISVRSLQRHIKAARLRSVTVGRRVLVKKTDVLNIFENGLRSETK